MVDSLLLGKWFSLLLDCLHWLLIKVWNYLIKRIQIRALIQIVLFNYHIKVQFVDNHAFLLRLFLIFFIKIQDQIFNVVKLLFSSFSQEFTQKDFEPILKLFCRRQKLFAKKNSILLAHAP